MTSTRAAALSLSLALPCALAAQTTASIACGRDNTLIENPNGSLSSGAGDGVFVGVTNQLSGATRRGVIWFDVAAVVPAGAVVIDATLSVNVAQASFFNPPSGFTVHRLLQDWGEGTSVPGPFPIGGGGGAPSTTNDATWIHTFYPGSTWTTPGGSFAGAASCSVPTPTLGAASSLPSVALLADVQSFVDNPATNFGWLLKTTEAVSNSAMRLDSRESTLGTPPVLQVTYLTNGQAASIGQGCTVGAQPFAQAWSAAPIGGTSLQLTLGNGPAGALAANLMALTFDPTGAILGPPCPAHLPFAGLVVTHSLVFLDGSGNGGANLSLPTGFPGVTLVSQGAAIASNPAGFILSNAVVAVLQ